MNKYIKCPHCEHKHYKDIMYPMLQRFNIHSDEATLKCQSCGKEFDYWYNEYYEILLEEN